MAVPVADVRDESTRRLVDEAYLLVSPSAVRQEARSFVNSIRARPDGARHDDFSRSSVVPSHQHTAGFERGLGVCVLVNIGGGAVRQPDRR